MRYLIALSCCARAAAAAAVYGCVYGHVVHRCNFFPSIFCSFITRLLAILAIRRWSSTRYGKTLKVENDHANMPLVLLLIGSCTRLDVSGGANPTQHTAPFQRRPSAVHRAPLLSQRKLISCHLVIFSGPPLQQQQCNGSLVHYRRPAAATAAPAPAVLCPAPVTWYSNSSSVLVR